MLVPDMNNVSVRSLMSGFGNWVTVAQTPRTRRILAMLEPITLPSAMPGAPFKFADMVTSNSGADVPNDTIVRPITVGDMPNMLARPTAPRIRISPAAANKANPKIKKKTS